MGKSSRVSAVAAFTTRLSAVDELILELNEESRPVVEL